jgi:hypothetical protein
MLPKMMARVVSAAALALAVLCSSAQAAPERRRLAVLFDPSAASLPQAEIRAAIAAELGALLVDDADSAEGVLSVALGEHGRIVMTYRPLQATVVRTVPEPPDSTDTPALLALVAGNLVRNEALELIPTAPRAPAPADPVDSATELVSPFPRKDPDLVSPFPPVTPADLVSPFPSEPEHVVPQLRQARPHDGAGSIRRRLFVMIGVGSGMGLSRGTPDLNPSYLDGQQARPLFVAGAHRVAGYHVAPEVAFLWRPDILVGAQLRLQHVLGTTPVHHPSCGSGGICHPPSTALALLGRAGWLRPLGDRARLQISGAVGLGRVRHLVFLDNQPAGMLCGALRNGPCKDTVASGLLLAGPGVALFHPFTSRAWVFASLQGLMSLPGSMLNVDGAAGLALRL